MRDEPKFRFNIHVDGERDAIMVCNWCGREHAVQQTYKDDFLSRDNVVKLSQAISKKLGVVYKPEDMWTCGTCFKGINGLPDSVMTDCVHEFPESPVERFKALWDGAKQ